MMSPDRAWHRIKWYGPMALKLDVIRLIPKYVAFRPACSVHQQSACCALGYYILAKISLPE